MKMLGTRNILKDKCIYSCTRRLLAQYSEQQSSRFKLNRKHASLVAVTSLSVTACIGFFSVQQFRSKFKETFSKDSFSLHGKADLVSADCSANDADLANPLCAKVYKLFTLHAAGSPPFDSVVSSNVSTDIKKTLGIPNFKVSKKVRRDPGSQAIQLTLYQYQTCPFCCKVRAYLDYHGFSYDIIEVNSVTRKQVKWSTKYKKVPILVCKDSDGTETALHDSSAIVSLLHSYRHAPEKVETLWKYYPEIESDGKYGRKKYEYPNKYFIMYGESKAKTPTQNEGKHEREWRAWVDDVLVHVLSPNIYRTPSEALQAFHYFSDVGEWKQHFPAWERYMVIYVGAAVMYLLGKSLKKKYKLKDDVRQSLYEVCDTWTKELKGKPFLGGEKPGLADVSMYGALSSIEGCPSFDDAVKVTKIGPWYYSTKKAVQTSQGSSGTT